MLHDVSDWDELFYRCVHSQASLGGKHGPEQFTDDLGRW